MALTGETGRAEALIDDVRTSLWRDVLDHWFPACLSAAGGFHQHFGRDWSREGGDDRFLVFQARMTWTCASIAAANGGGPFADHAQRGLAMLDRMMHRPTGAYHWETDAVGRPGGICAKGARLYGQAFAIYGLAAAARALGSEEALAAARRLFAWLERAHHDRRHGGYFEYVRFSGRPFFRSRTLRRHVIGGYKSANSHIHLLEAFIDLYRLWPDPTLRLRLEELIVLLTQRWWLEPGRINGVAALDCAPILGKYSYGHDLEVAHLLLDAADALGRPGDAGLLAKAQALLETSLAESWDEEHGGFFDPQSQAASIPEPAKVWWVQAEGLACLARLAAASGNSAWRSLLERHWQWIRTRQIDLRDGGWLESVSADGRPVGDLAKGKPWKEVYHEVRAAMVLARACGGTAEAMLSTP